MASPELRKPQNTIMKNIFSILLLCVNLSAFAQTNVTKFLGIPVDGYKHEMIEKLKEKGFTESKYINGFLEGEFNGEEVYVSVVTNNNKVYRIAIMDKSSRGETDIKIRFNRLCNQFLNNERYFSMNENCKIEDNEDISYEITVNDKRYEAAFAQKAEIPDSLTFVEKMQKEILNDLTEEERSDTINIKKALGALWEMTKYRNLLNSYKNSVWFMISKSPIAPMKYIITMFYDNKNNEANGEDL